MKIPIKPKYLVCCGEWSHKTESVILVKSEEERIALFEALRAQDEYWASSHIDLIKIAPKEITHFGQIDALCGYTGKTDIYDIKALKEKFEFIIYQKL